MLGPALGPRMLGCIRHIFSIPRDVFSRCCALDLGGGLGVVERPGQAPLDIAKVGVLLARFKALHPEVELWLEPGRYLVAQAASVNTG